MSLTAITILSLALFGTEAPVAAAEDARPTAGFRAQHAEIETHLAHLDAMVSSLGGASVEEQRTTMAFVARFLDEHIRSHAAWEEAKLYPLVDSKASRGPEPFSASMRHEHRIIGRSIDALAQLGSAPTPDAAAFARAANRLLGVISAHFEKEEEVFLPILDRSMSREELEKALGSKHP